MDLLYKFNMNLGQVDTLAQVSPSIISIVVFGVYVASGEELTAEVCFTVLSLLNLLN